MKVVPTVNSSSFKKIRRQIKVAENFRETEWFQIDISDRKFTSRTTWNNPQELKTIDTKLKIEIHLMIENPEESIKEWLSPKVKRLMIHIEALRKLNIILKKTKNHPVEIGLALNPETPLQTLFLSSEKSILS
jgi:ribulose-phosphate 3-epimerase